MTGRLGKSALVVTTNRLSVDPVAQKEIYWLKANGWDVTTLSPADSEYSGAPNIPLVSRRIPFVWLSRIVMRNSYRRWKYLYGHIFESEAVLEALSKMDLVVNNDLDLLPGLIEAKQKSVRSRHGNFRLHVHLYELFHSAWPGWRWKLFREGHLQFLTQFIGNPAVNGWSTISPAAALDYEATFPGTKFGFLLNTARYEEIEPSELHSNRIELVYVGAVGPDRSIDTLVDAFEQLEDRFSLNFVINGVPSYIKYLKGLAEKSSGRITVFDAVPMDSVPTFISRFDVSLIFFPPINKNAEQTLGNKFFQSIQAGLGIVVGKSPGMQGYVEKYDLGVVVAGWRAEDLSSALNSLTAEQFRTFKVQSRVAAHELSTERQVEHFKSTVLEN